MVTHRGEFCRILLASHSPLHGAELLEGWSLQQKEQRNCWLCQLAHCILNDTMDGHSILSLISLLDRVRSGWFDVICLFPAAATWSRARHFGSGQKPLRSRAEPFGVQCLDPLSISKITASNQQLEFDSFQNTCPCVQKHKALRGTSSLTISNGPEFKVLETVLFMSGNCQLP